MSEEEFYNSSDSIRSGSVLRYVREATLTEPLRLLCGQELPEVTIAYETYGSLDESKSNAILICHALSGDSHVASHDEQDDPGWWDILIGPGKYIDTNKYYVICPNALGGCRGTTGPDSINPKTGIRYGMDFPQITIEDIVEVQRRLVHDVLGIEHLLAVVGGSLGGQMALIWGTSLSQYVDAIVAVATSAHLTSQALAFDIVARNAIVSDPQFHKGQYYDKGNGPATGLAIARMLGHITYLSLESMKKKFGSARNCDNRDNTSFETRFSVGSYLAHQGHKFVERFDANSYLSLSLAIDMFDLGETKEDLAAAFRKSQCRWLFLSFSSDWLFPPFQSREMVNAALAEDRQVSYCNIESDCGHDAFLLANEADQYGTMIGSFLENTLQTSRTHQGTPLSLPNELDDQEPPKKHRIDLDNILRLIPEKSRILDLGCGKGDLLVRLRESGHDHLVGLELNEHYVLRCVEKGLNVVHADLDDGLAAFSDRQFDYVVLSKTLQTVRKVELVLEEMLRVGRQAIVSFPNLGYKKFREELEERGRAPHTDPRPKSQWYNTNDVRFLTISDFHDLCESKGWKIHRQVALDTEENHVIETNPNLNADVVIVVLSKD
ncbi:MAG: homoserine O-acetyltransferase [Planctomycetia bacterium]|nr:homoserine O-acetyltransferase [Planctomycetia bacterium]